MATLIVNSEEELKDIIYNHSENEHPFIELNNINVILVKDAPHGEHIIKGPFNENITL